MLSTAPPGGKIALYWSITLSDPCRNSPQTAELLQAKAESLWGEFGTAASKYAGSGGDRRRKRRIGVSRDCQTSGGNIGAESPLSGSAWAFQTMLPFRHRSENNDGAASRSGAEWAVRAVRVLESASRVAGKCGAVTFVSSGHRQSGTHLGNSNIVVESVEAKYLGATVIPDTGPITSYVNTLQMIAERTAAGFSPRYE